MRNGLARSPVWPSLGRKQRPGSWRRPRQQIQQMCFPETRCSCCIPNSDTVSSTIRTTGHSIQTLIQRLRRRRHCKIREGGLISGNGPEIRSSSQSGSREGKEGASCCCCERGEAKRRKLFSSAHSQRCHVGRVKKAKSVSGPNFLLTHNLKRIPVHYIKLISKYLI